MTKYAIEKLEYTSVGDFDKIDVAYYAGDNKTGKHRFVDELKKAMFFRTRERAAKESNLIELTGDSRLIILSVETD